MKSILRVDIELIKYEQVKLVFLEFDEITLIHLRWKIPFWEGTIEIVSHWIKALSQKVIILL